MANRQEIVCTYIYENYVQFGRLRTRGWIVYERTLDEVNANRNKKE